MSIYTDAVKARYEARESETDTFGRVKGGPISGRCGGVKPGQWLSAA